MAWVDEKVEEPQGIQGAQGNRNCEIDGTPSHKKMFSFGHIENYAE